MGAHVRVDFVSNDIDCINRSTGTCTAMPDRTCRSYQGWHWHWQKALALRASGSGLAVSSCGPRRSVLVSGSCQARWAAGLKSDSESDSGRGPWGRMRRGSHVTGPWRERAAGRPGLPPPEVHAAPPGPRPARNRGPRLGDDRRPPATTQSENSARGATPPAKLAQPRRPGCRDVHSVCSSPRASLANPAARHSKLTGT